MDLETAFYTVGIIFMGLMLIILVALVIAVFAIRAKIVSLHKQVEEKIDQVTGLASTGGKIAARVADIASKNAKKALRK